MVTWLAYKILSLFGWEFEGGLPDDPKFIIAGAPHTTNWDFILFLAALHYYDMKVSFLGKHTLFRWPFRYFFEALGGIPVNRNRPGGVVAQVKDAFDSRDEMILVVAPEGTRGRTDFWKSGFIKIAEGVGVPVVFAAVDYPSKTVRLSPPVTYRGDLRAFMDEARAIFSNSKGLKPDNGGPVRVREEGHST